MMSDFWNDVKDWAKASIPFVGAGLDFLGGILGNSANAAEASRNRQFVAKMYKKRYQFTVEDMRKAGLNPILAANGGNVGSISSTPTASFENPFHGAINSAVSAANAVQDVQNKIAQRGLTESQTSLNQSKEVAQDINNKYLDSQARAFAEKAQHEASIANSAAVMAKAREVYADVYAQNERDESWGRQHNMTTRDLANHATIEDHLDRMNRRMNPRVERKLAEELYRANILYKQMAPFWSGVNSASRVIGGR